MYTILVLISFFISRYGIVLKKKNIWAKRAAAAAALVTLAHSPMHVLPHSTAKNKQPVTALKPFLKRSHTSTIDSSPAKVLELMPSTTSPNTVH
jgi:hypothetical protein